MSVGALVEKKSSLSNTRLIKSIREDNRLVQVSLVNRFLNTIKEETETNPELFLTDRGIALANAVMKLEIKDMQIEAQKEANSNTNNLFLSVAQAALREVMGIDRMSKNNLERELPIEIEAIDIMDEDEPDPDEPDPGDELFDE
jgi:hypothetical protein